MRVKSSILFSLFLLQSNSEKVQIRVQIRVQETNRVFLQVFTIYVNGIDEEAFFELKGRFSGIIMCDFQDEARERDAFRGSGDRNLGTMKRDCVVYFCVY